MQDRKRSPLPPPWLGRTINLGFAGMTVGAMIALGASIGLALGSLISLATDVLLAPEAGLVLGAAAGWLLRRER